MQTGNRIRLKPFLKVTCVKSKGFTLVVVHAYDHNYVQ